jgi:hypothetical protein
MAAGGGGALSMAAFASVALAVAAITVGSQRALLDADMAPVGTALALLFINCYGMLSVSPKSGVGPRAAFIAALFIGKRRHLPCMQATLLSTCTPALRRLPCT